MWQRQLYAFLEMGWAITIVTAKIGALPIKHKDFTIFHQLTDGAWVSLKIGYAPKWQFE